MGKNGKDQLKHERRQHEVMPLKPLLGNFPSESTQNICSYSMGYCIAFILVYVCVLNMCTFWFFYMSAFAHMFAQNCFGSLRMDASLCYENLWLMLGAYDPDNDVMPSLSNYNSITGNLFILRLFHHNLSWVFGDIHTMCICVSSVQ